MTGLRAGHLVAAAFAAAGFAALAAAGDGRTDPKEARDDVEVAGSWIYDDVDRGFAEAKSSGRPLLVVFR